MVAPNCEQVDKAGSGAGPGAGGPKPGGLTGRSSYTRRALKRGVAFEHTCAAACTITVKLVTARLTGKAKRRLGRLRKGAATLKVTVVDGGQTQRFEKRVKLKR